MKTHLDYYLLFLRTRTSRGTLKRTQDLGEKRHTLQPGGQLSCARMSFSGVSQSRIDVNFA